MTGPPRGAAPSSARGERVEAAPTGSEPDRAATTVTGDRHPRVTPSLRDDEPRAEPTLGGHLPADTAPAAIEQTVDFGQNVNGWVRLCVTGAPGTEITLTHGEALDADGRVTRDHFIPASLRANPAVTPGQVDRVTLSGRPGEVFEPRHTTHGFRYVGVEGLDRPLTPDEITAVVVHTDLRRTGHFRCSDADLDRLYDAAVWSFRGNACDIPTDCPTRERAGWTGDWQIFVATAARMYDVAGFSTKWLRDLASEQRPDGTVTSQVPGGHLIGGGFFTDVDGAAGWGDAAVIVPWEIHRAYGDVDLLRRQWPSMTAWVDHAARCAATARHPDRVAARPEPAAHERYLWDTGFHWGEWMEPGVELSIAHQVAGDSSVVATAYLHHSAHLLARIARLLGDDAAERHYREIADGARTAWQAEFVDADGRLRPDTQATHVRALAFGLVPDELRPRVAERLVALIREAGTHLGTGFLATPHLLPVLADAGHADVAYELLAQRTVPSWLAMLDRGATTIWESWEGIDDEGRPSASLNHYSKGAVVSFLVTHTAGIRLLDDHPAYERFAVAPVPGGGLTWAEASLDTPQGRVASRWRIDGRRFALTVEVPPGSTADVRLPDGRQHTATVGSHRFECDLPA